MAHNDIGSVVIAPADMEVRERAVALWIWNEYKALGFYKRQSFVELVQTYNENYNRKDGISLLNRFWAGRITTRELNNDLKRILQKIKEDPKMDAINNTSEL